MSTDDFPRLTVSCPLCQARVGAPCRTITTPLRPLPYCHLERIQAYYRALR